MWIYWLLMLVLVISDQIIKAWIAGSIAVGSAHVVVPGLLSLTNLHNNGAAWSILEGKMYFFYIVTTAALAVMIYLLYRLRHQRLYELGLAMMIAGTIGNFVDRLRIGYVVDMFQLDFINFPIFNFADTCLTVGVILILIAVLREDSSEGISKKNE